MTGTTDTSTRTVAIDPDHPAIRYLIEGWAHLCTDADIHTTAAAALYLQQQIEAQS